METPNPGGTNDLPQPHNAIDTASSILAYFFTPLYMSIAILLLFVTNSQVWVEVANIFAS